jgi:hypothetical protein
LSSDIDLGGDLIRYRVAAIHSTARQALARRQRLKQMSGA